MDFWLDAEQHENLCRAYFKGVYESGRTIKEDWPEYWDYARRRGSIYDPVTRTPFSSGHTPTSAHGHVGRAPIVIPRSAPVTRRDLIASAEHIFLRYLSPPGNTVGGIDNREIYVPPDLRIDSFPLTGQRDPRSHEEKSIEAQVPDMFHAQKEYYFQTMEVDAFRRFLRSRTPGSLIPLSPVTRLIARRQVAAVRELFSTLGPQEIRNVNSGDENSQNIGNLAVANRSWT